MSIFVECKLNNQITLVFFFDKTTFILLQTFLILWHHASFLHREFNFVFVDFLTNLLNVDRT